MSGNQAKIYESSIQSLLMAQQAYFAEKDSFASSILDLAQFIGHPIVYHFIMYNLVNYLCLKLSIL